MTLKVATIGQAVYVVITDEFNEDQTFMLSNESARELGHALVYASHTPERDYKFTREV